METTVNNISLSKRYQKLSETGDPLERLNGIIDWRRLEPWIEKAFEKEKKSPAGRKPYYRLMMFKVLVIQTLYHLSDNRMEFQIRDRLSFMRFLGLGLEEEVPDEKTIWLFREELIRAGVLGELFNRFEMMLEEKGYRASVGSMIDTSMVEVPKQRNSREVNEEIKEGKIPDCIQENPNRLRQKDLDARWAVKNGKSYYGYKLHINADTKYKLIRKYKITIASVNDIHGLPDLLDDQNDDKHVWADSAYDSQTIASQLDRRGFINRIVKKCPSYYPPWSARSRENFRRSKIRKRVEHVFGFMENSMGGKFIRTIGLVRAKAKIILMSLVYNMCRLEQLERLGAH